LLLPELVNVLDQKPLSPILKVKKWGVDIGSCDE
jgi:hypothetical protein